MNTINALPRKVKSRFRELAPLEKKAAVAEYFGELERRYLFSGVFSPRLAAQFAVYYDLPDWHTEAIFAEFCRRYGIGPSLHSEDAAKALRDAAKALRDAAKSDEALRGSRLGGVRDGLALEAGLAEEIRLIPPPSSEELARRKAQQDAATAAQPVLCRIGTARDRLQAGEGLPRRFGCGYGDPLAFRGKDEPYKVFASQHYCGSLDCPCCEAYYRARLIRHAVQVTLHEIPDGGVLPPHRQSKALSLPWQTAPLYRIECPDDKEKWEALRKRINRASAAVGASGEDRLSCPGWLYRRLPSGELVVITEAPIPGAVELPAAEAATIIAEAIGLDPLPLQPRRQNDIRFGGRWTQRQKESQWQRVECHVSLKEFAELAEECGAEDVRPINIKGMGDGLFCQFESPDESAMTVRKNGGDPIGAALVSHQRFESFLEAIATGLVRFSPNRESGNTVKTDSGSATVADPLSEAELEDVEKVLAGFSNSP